MANTSAPLSEVAIANMGANVLDEKALTTLDDAGSYAKLCAREFGYVRDEVLRVFPWPFAQELTLLPVDTVTPAFAWDYSYQLPSDFIRLVYVRESGAINGKKIPFQRIGNKLYTNKSGGLPIVYVKRVTNAALFDPLFARVVGSTLALLGAQRITGKVGYVDKARLARNEALQTAMDVASREIAHEEYVDTAFDDDVLSVRGVGLTG